MNDVISEIFGYIVLVSAIVLFIWENRQFRQRDEHDAWLMTANRFRRRAVISVVLGIIGCLIVAESRSLINIHAVFPFTMYVFALTGFAILLLFLAALDLMDTAKNAQRRALFELENSIREEAAKRQEHQSREGESG